jgi:hypothetical protein
MTGSPWPDHEYARGWGVFALPFDSGHVLGLRVFDESTFGAYTSVWHRTPAGAWSIHVDGPRLETACPRYYGPACERTGLAHIDVAWTGRNAVRVTMDDPALEWTLTTSSTALLRAANAMEAAMPLASWKPRPLVRMREAMARLLGMGRVELAGPVPSGHDSTLMPREMFYINDSRAVLDGVDLGRPVRLRTPPRIGDVPLPTRGVLARGQSVWRRADASVGVQPFA